MWMKESSSNEVLYLAVWCQALAHCERRKRFSDLYLWDLQHIKIHLCHYLQRTIIASEELINF